VPSVYIHFSSRYLVAARHLLQPSHSQYSCLHVPVPVKPQIICHRLFANSSRVADSTVLILALKSAVNRLGFYVTHDSNKLWNSSTTTASSSKSLRLRQDLYQDPPCPIMREYQHAHGRSFSEGSAATLGAHGFKERAFTALGRSSHLPANQIAAEKM
jgi:hypothetical protein